MSTAMLERNTETMTGKEGKYLTFTLADQEYGVEIIKVKEIIRAMEVTEVPQTPDYVEGVINLRGKIIPVINLRVKFGMENRENTDRTCIIVVEIGERSGAIPMGVVVDSVSEVLHIRLEEMEATPNFGAKSDTGYMMGMAKTRGKVIILLAIDQVLNSEGMLLIERLRTTRGESGPESGKGEE